MKIADFEIYKSMLYDRSGLVITPDKSYLLESRLTPIAKKWGHPSLEAMTLQLRALPDENLLKDIVEAMTTNETSFFRDTKPFQIFQDTVLPHMLEARKTRKTIRIWCAACSSGQEPYSLAMILKDKEAELKGWRFEIVATDLSDDILASAKKAAYSQFEVQRGLPIQYLMKYFSQVGEAWQLKDEIKNMVKFSAFNLLDDMSRMGSFDVVFCRNVLIYFDEKTKGQVLERMAKQMEEDAFLFLGGAETVLGITNKFVAKPEKRGLYIKNSGQSATTSSSGLRPTTQPPSTPPTTGGFTSGLFKRP